MRQRGDYVLVVDAQGELGIVGRIYVLSKNPTACTGVFIVMYINSLSHIGNPMHPLLLAPQENDGYSFEKRSDQYHYHHPRDPAQA